MFKKIFSGFAKKQAGTKQAEEIIQSITTAPFAKNDNNEIHFGYDELGGFFMLKTFIIGELFVKTNQGAQLELDFKDGTSLNLKADALEFASELSSVSGRSITFIDYDLQKKELAKIQNSKIARLTLKVKKEILIFEVNA